MNYLSPENCAERAEALSVLALAHLGDAVFELMTRTFLSTAGYTANMNLHRLTVGMVNAPAQHRFYERISSSLTEEELAVYKRGRNTRVNSVPKNASLADYHSATGLEALFGWLYLHNRTERLNELFEMGLPDA